MIAGVSGGLASYFGIDTTIVRLFMVLAAIFTGGLVLVIYFVAALVIPDEPFGFTAAPTASATEFATPGESASAGESQPGVGAAGGTPDPGFGRFRYSSEEHRQYRQHWFGWALVALGALILMS